MTAESAVELREFVDRQADATKVYMLPIEVPPDEGEVPGEQIDQVRLMPNVSGMRFSGRVRETLRPSIEAEVGYVKGNEPTTAPPVGRTPVHRAPTTPPTKTSVAEAVTFAAKADIDMTGFEPDAPAADRVAWAKRKPIQSRTVIVAV